MRRTACALALAAVISAAACGTSNAFPVAPLPAEMQIQTSDITQVRWYRQHQRHYRHWYWQRTYWYPQRYYWGWSGWTRPSWGWWNY